MISFKNFTEASIMAEKDMYARLKHNDLTKRGGARVDVFLKKIKDKEEFLTTKGSVKLKPPPPNKPEFSKAGHKQDFDTERNGKVKYPNQFFKTPDLGGKGVGFGTRAEDRELAGLRKEIEAMMEKTQSGVLNMFVGKRKVVVAGVASTPGTPKSDFHLLDDKGEEVAWISHKDGRGPGDFQQYGGLAHKVFQNNKEVRAFMEALQNEYPDGMKRGDSAKRELKDRKVINQSVWGVDYGGARGRNNVDEFHQGPMKIKKAGADTYKIVSRHSDTNGSIPKGGYKAIFYARYTGDRNARIAGINFKNSRVGVFSAAQPSKGTKSI